MVGTHCYPSLYFETVIRPSWVRKTDILGHMVRRFRNLLPNLALLPQGGTLEFSGAINAYLLRIATISIEKELCASKQSKH